MVPGLSSPSPFRSIRLNRIVLTFLLALGCGDGGSPSEPGDPVELVPCTLPDSRCRERVPLAGGLLLPVYRTHPLTRREPALVRVVIVVHGANRNPDDYFETMVLAAQEAGALSETLVLAPHFQTVSDGPGTAEPAWTSNGWKRGDPSVGGSGSAGLISSYAAVDGILRILGDSARFPNLEKVVVTGHSAGGQYAHRFAAGSRMEDSLPQLRFRYVVANPSTYLYLGPQRARVGNEAFGIPNRAECPGYNEWHYGLEALNPYMAEMTLTEIRGQLVRRDVVYLAGDRDTGSDMLDVSCGAMLQGPNRYFRALTLFAYLALYYPGHGHRLYEIPGVGHSSRGVYTSEIGGAVLFGW